MTLFEYKRSLPVGGGSLFFPPIAIKIMMIQYKYNSYIMKRFNCLCHMWTKHSPFKLLK